MEFKVISISRENTALRVIENIKNAAFFRSMVNICPIKQNE